MPQPLPEQSSPLAATLSALLPGLGQAYRNRHGQGAWVFGAVAALVVCGWWLGQVQDRAAEIFFFLLILMPWWVLQSYNAYLPSSLQHNPLIHTIQTAWGRAHDIRYLGVLFLVSAILDLYIIVKNPSYSLPFFCEKPTGFLGLLAKAQSPTLHILIGYGFFTLRRWALMCYLGYAGVGLMNATVNFACFGFGRIRTVLVIALLAFSAYILWRRQALLTPERTHNHRP